MRAWRWWRSRDASWRLWSLVAAACFVRVQFVEGPAYVAAYMVLFWLAVVAMSLHARLARIEHAMGELVEAQVQTEEAIQFLRRSSSTGARAQLYQSVMLKKVLGEKLNALEENR